MLLRMNAGILSAIVYLARSEAYECLTPSSPKGALAQAIILGKT
jgi:hypothetical protein